MAIVQLLSIVLACCFANQIARVREGIGIADGYEYDPGLTTVLLFDFLSLYTTLQSVMNGKLS